MKNKKGITLIALAITILVLFVISAIIITTTTKSISRMSFETFKVKLEEIQRKVNEISSDYDLYKKVNVNASYKEYFESKFGTSPMYLKNSGESTRELLEAKENLKAKEDSEFIFYFRKDDIKEYLGLKGLEGIVIDFENRSVYSTKGFKDPEDKTKIYYCQEDYGGSTKVSEKKYATRWELELEVELGNEFRVGSSIVTDYVTKKSVIKILYENGSASIVSSDLEYGTAKATDANAWVSRLRVKDVKIKSFNILEEKDISSLRNENIKYGDEWDLDLALSLGSEFRYSTSVVTDFITKDAIIKIHSDNNQVSVESTSDFSYGQSGTQDARAWNIRVRVKSCEIDNFNIIGEEVKLTTNISSERVGNMLIHQIQLALDNNELFGTYYPLERVYYSKNNGESWVEIKDASITQKNVNFNLYDYNGGTYIFKIVDSSGASKISDSIEIEKFFTINVELKAAEVIDNHVELNIIAKNERYPIKCIEIWCAGEKIKVFEYEDSPLQKNEIYNLENMEFLKELDCYAKVINTIGDEAVSDTLKFTNTNSIGNLRDLKIFRSQVNSGNTFKNSTIYLVNDVATGGSWIPIGYYDARSSWTGYYFEGIFDGRGNKITITSLSTDSTYKSIGLFGMIIGGSVKNLTVEGTINGTTDSFIGGICRSVEKWNYN